MQYDAHKHIWWANLGKFFQTSRKKRRDTKKKEKRQRKIKATRKERAASVRAAIKAELNTATCDKATLRARVSTQVGFSLEDKFWRYVFEQKLQKEIQAQRVQKKAKVSLQVGIQQGSTEEEAPAASDCERAAASPSPSPKLKLLYEQRECSSEKGTVGASGRAAAEERAASYERARPSSAREREPRDCDQDLDKCSTFIHASLPSRTEKNN